MTFAYAHVKRGEDDGDKENGDDVVSGSRHVIGVCICNTATPSEARTQCQAIRTQQQTVLQVDVHDAG